MHWTKTKFIIIAFLICSVASAQIDFSPETWRLIDTSIEKKKNLSDILGLVRGLRQKALFKKNILLHPVVLTMKCR